ncbi:FAD dependent oxidoreductase-domain-containing protein [Sordaria brevicollis]|uniref:FAD dependent oxidoreductase-domain-containing protein n=1 Tax=Sordaria brevicollis TaxID=83679 RepID=A0AAE0PMT2_SORBR|nr:FAD dependent oxidoreductase-domain-containing protein [Sordaria brevicollis]
MVIRDNEPPSSSYHTPTYSTREIEYQFHTFDQPWHNRVHDDDVAGLPSPYPSASYWLQDTEESRRLENYRSTLPLPRSADTVIIGSGITGAFAAWFLLEATGGVPLGHTPLSSATSTAAAGQQQQRQRQQQTQQLISDSSSPPSVLMLEARQPCSGATGRNGGHCQPLIYSSSSETAEFELATYDFIKGFVEEHGLEEVVDWKTLKTVHGYLTGEVWEGAKGLVEALPEGLRKEVDLVDAETKGEGGETLRDLRVPGVKGAVVQKRAASLWPYKLVAWVLERLIQKYPIPPPAVPGAEGVRKKDGRKGGFNLQSNTAVTDLHQASDGRWLVRTSRDGVPIWANRVLLATNGYTSKLLPKMKDLIVPVRSQVAALRPPRYPPTSPTGKGKEKGKVAELEYSYAFVSEEKFPRDEYLIQRPLSSGGELIYGGARSHADAKAVGVWQDDDVERGVATYLRQNLAPYPLDLSIDKTGAVPSQTPKDGDETTELKATYQWTGIMGFSRDASPWVGNVPESLGGGENLFVCGGYTGHGMPQAALAARMVVEEILGRKVRDDGLELPREMRLTEERVNWVRENTKTLKEQQEAPGWSATMPELLGATERRA